MNQKENARQKQDLRVLMEHFDPVQMDRYEAFRRSGLTKSAVRKVSATPSHFLRHRILLFVRLARQSSLAAVRLSDNPHRRAWVLQGLRGRDHRERCGPLQLLQAPVALTLVPSSTINREPLWSPHTRRSSRSAPTLPRRARKDGRERHGQEDVCALRSCVVSMALSSLQASTMRKIQELHVFVRRG